VWKRTSRLIVGGQVSASTDANGLVSVSNPFAPLIPSWVQVTIQNPQQATDDLARILSAIVWTAPLTGAASFLLRFRRSDNNQWATSQPIAAFMTVGLEP
jgi:hypothetical protein